MRLVDVVDTMRLEIELYELLDPSTNIDELNDNIKFVAECFRTAAYDVCTDNGYDFEELCEIEVG